MVFIPNIVGKNAFIGKKLGDKRIPFSFSLQQNKQSQSRQKKIIETDSFLSFSSKEQTNHSCEKIG